MLRIYSEGKNNREGFEEGTAGSDISSSVGLFSCSFSLDSALLAFSLYYVRREGQASWQSLFRDWQIFLSACPRLMSMDRETIPG